jgi:hypothetical protein
VIVFLPFSLGSMLAAAYIVLRSFFMDWLILGVAVQLLVLPAHLRNQSQSHCYGLVPTLLMFISLDLEIVGY